jgi:hypothetical protein
VFNKHRATIFRNPDQVYGERVSGVGAALCFKCHCLFLPLVFNPQCLAQLLEAFVYRAPAGFRLGLEFFYQRSVTLLDCLSRESQPISTGFSRLNRVVDFPESAHYFLPFFAAGPGVVFLLAINLTCASERIAVLPILSGSIPSFLIRSWTLLSEMPSLSATLAGVLIATLYRLQSEFCAHGLFPLPARFGVVNNPAPGKLSDSQAVCCRVADLRDEVFAVVPAAVVRETVGGCVVACYRLGFAERGCFRRGVADGDKFFVKVAESHFRSLLLRFRRSGFCEGDAQRRSVDVAQVPYLLRVPAVVEQVQGTFARHAGKRKRRPYKPCAVRRIWLVFLESSLLSLLLKFGFRPDKEILRYKRSVCQEKKITNGNYFMLQLKHGFKGVKAKTRGVRAVKGGSGKRIIHEYRHGLAVGNRRAADTALLVTCS